MYFTDAELAGRDPATLRIVKTNAATIEINSDHANTKFGGATVEQFSEGYLFGKKVTRQIENIIEVSAIPAA